MRTGDPPVRTESRPQLAALLPRVVVIPVLAFKPFTAKRLVDLVEDL